MARDDTARDSDSGTSLLELGSDDGTANLRYEFPVDGTVRKRTSSTDSGFVAESGGTVEGRVGGGTDRFRFSGEDRQFHLDGSAFVGVQDGS